MGLPAGSGNCGPSDLFFTWRCETVDPSGKWVTYRNGDYLSLAVGPTGVPAIAYYQYITATGGNMAVAYRVFKSYVPYAPKNP